MKRYMLTLIFAFVLALIGFSQADSVAVDTEIPVTTEATTLIDYLLGGMDTVQFIAFLIFAFAGQIVNICFGIWKRNKKSKRSPEGFSILFWFKDNWKRLLGTIVLIPCAILLGEHFFATTMNNGIAFFVGGGIDAVVEVLKKRNLVVGGVKDVETDQA